MNRHLVLVATGALAAGLVVTMLTATADAVPAPAVGVADVASAPGHPGPPAPPGRPTSPSTTTTLPTTSPTTTSPTTTAPSKNRGVVVAVPRNSASTVTLTRRFAPRTVFSVSLYENPSTGYGWSQSVPTGSTGPVTLLDTDYAQDLTPTAATGTGGTRYFRYLVTSPGTSTITFLYRRPWETGVPPLQQVTLTVVAG